MAVAQIMAQLEQQPRLNTHGAVPLQAQREGQAVGGSELHRLLPLQKQIGVFPQRLQSPVAEAPVQRHGEPEGQVVNGEEIQQAAHSHLKAEGLAHGQSFLSCDAPDPGHLLGFFLQYAQGVLPELVYHTPRGGRPHAAHGARGQIVEHRLFAPGHAPLHNFRLELLSEGAVARPGAVDGEPFSGSRARHAAHHRNFALFPRVHVQNGIAVFLVSEDHGFYSPFDCAQRFREFHPLSFPL